jgi:hypothetical protein
MKILGLDPGSKNFGWAVIEVETGETYLKDTYVELPKVLESGLLQNQLAYFDSNSLDSGLLRLCVQELQEICIRNLVDEIVIERWMGRGTFMPGWVERLNHVIGAMMYSRRTPITAITAASWKSRILNRYGIKSTKTLVGCVKTEHAGDAVMQGLYLHEVRLEARQKEEKKMEREKRRLEKATLKSLPKKKG